MLDPLHPQIVEVPLLTSPRFQDVLSFTLALETANRYPQFANQLDIRNLLTPSIQFMLGDIHAQLNGELQHDIDILYEFFRPDRRSECLTVLSGVRFNLPKLPGDRMVWYAVTDFSMRFRRTAIALGLPLLPDIYIAALPTCLREPLASERRVNPDATLDDIVNVAIDLAKEFDRARAYPPSSLASSQGPSRPNGNPTRAPAAPRVPATPAPQGHQPNARDRRTRLTADEKDYRREHHLCAYCGANDHLLDACPLRPDPPRQAVAATPPQTPRRPGAFAPQRAPPAVAHAIAETPVQPLTSQDSLPLSKPSSPLSSPAPPVLGSQLNDLSDYLPDFSEYFVTQSILAEEEREEELVTVSAIVPPTSKLIGSHVPGETRIKLFVKHHDSYFAAVPDTGATRSHMNEQLARLLGLELHPIESLGGKITISVANGGTEQVSHYVSVNARLAQGAPERPIHFLVTNRVPPHLYALIGHADTYGFSLSISNDPYPFVFLNQPGLEDLADHGIPDTIPFISTIVLTLFYMILLLSIL
eukprot:TRINITY_DN2790_c1_g1_i11.p1 TRINITY_DN2790_c1_g1~~TRINITY_DN2790_c1_g1_i11.p1  ORF type:complete len:531 (+),score=58.98 TRINITY_DN2790_c1_g1_i11:864-2456(+)